MDAKILTLHPDGKHGARIDRAKYDTIKTAIVAALETQAELAFTELVQEVERALSGRFDGSVPWYVTTVKLDLEARGVIRRIPKRSPQMLQLV